MDNMFIKKFKRVFNNLLVPLSLILVIVFLLNIGLTLNLNKVINNKISEAEEAARPAKIKLTAINVNCNECFDIKDVIELIKENNVEVTEEENFLFNSADAKNLISKYSIKKLPTVLVSGEIDKANLNILERENDVLILRQIEPPYADANGKVYGLVSLTLIESKSCKECTDLDLSVEQIENLGVKITNKEILDVYEAKNIIKEFNIEVIPTMILNEEAKVYDIIDQIWGLVGTIDNGTYVLRKINPPYLNLTNNKVEGLVDVTYLTDESCVSCYNVTLHRQILDNPSGLNIYLNNEEVINISSNKGKELIDKYEIINVPTIIVSKEASVYSGLNQVWEQVGSIEDDGTYVFRNTELMGNYKDIVTNKVIEVK